MHLFLLMQCISKCKFGWPSARAENLHCIIDYFSIGLLVGCAIAAHSCLNIAPNRVPLFGASSLVTSFPVGIFVGDYIHKGPSWPGTIFVDIPEPPSLEIFIAGLSLLKMSDRYTWDCPT